MHPKQWVGLGISEPTTGLQVIMRARISWTIITSMASTIPGWKDPPKWSVDPRKPELLQGLQEADLSTASPIQQQSLLAIFAGKVPFSQGRFWTALESCKDIMFCPFSAPPLYVLFYVYTSISLRCGDPVVEKLPFSQATNGNGRTEAFSIALLEKCHATKKMIQGF